LKPNSKAITARTAPTHGNVKKIQAESILLISPSNVAYEIIAIAIAGFRGDCDQLAKPLGD